jgi:hypothetical protein
LGDTKLNKTVKKLVTIFLIFVFLITGLTTSSAYTIEKNVGKIKCIKALDAAPLTKTITVYRYGVNGEITPVEIELELEKGIDINEAISKKCEELLENDIEFQSYKKLRLNIGILSFVNTRGRGLHLKPFLRFHFILCRYSNDRWATTTIRPLIGGNATTIRGPHRVMSFGFFGFKWWLDRISTLGFFLRTGYTGFSILTTIREF